MKLPWKRIVATLVLLVVGLPQLSAQANVDVSGLGFFHNKALDQRLAFLSGVDESQRQALTFADVEDSAYLLLQLLRREGYANPKVIGKLTQVGGEHASITWEFPFVSQQLNSADLSEIDSVGFTCEPGILDFYRSVKIDGITVIDPARAEAFFIPSGVLFTKRTDRSFTTSNLDSRINRLLDFLRSEGHGQAKILNRDIQRDPDTGAVDLYFEVQEGPVFQVGTVRTRVDTPDGAGVEEESNAFEGAILNRSWLRERRQALLNRWYAAGYPDAVVTVEQENRPDTAGGRVVVDVSLYLQTGTFRELAAVAVEPEDLLAPSVIRRQVQLEIGEPFDLPAVEKGRRKLLSLGVLRDATVEEIRLTDGTSEARYQLDPLPRRTLKLLLGWGSYELGRIGAKWERLNLWQRAHRYEIEAKKSFKSHLLQGTYVVPHFFDERNTGFGRASHEFREEISFDRTTTQVSLGASRQLKLRGAEVSLEYSYENVDTTRPTDDDFEALDRATISSLIVRGILDRRNSLTDPTRGYDLSFSLKTATDVLGGEANFHRLEVGTSYHKYLGSALYAHLSFRYGSIFSRSPTEANLPFNERFFPGGENTVRGYQRGEASPITAEGEEIGAESFALGNVELEQRILRNFSVVVFWDGIGISRKRAGWPREDFLQSVGLGLRWRTAVGPIRLEYGHNLDPRQGDPDGTLHFAVGYPF
jgi:outer membrane protein insertion porin family